jgi:hypothetical protein
MRRQRGCVSDSFSKVDSVISSDSFRLLARMPCCMLPVMYPGFIIRPLAFSEFAKSIPKEPSCNCLVIVGCCLLSFTEGY